MTAVDDVRARLERIGQGHLLTFFDALTPAQRDALLGDIEALDLDALPGLTERFRAGERHESLPDDLAPAPFVPRDAPTAAARAVGESLLADGKVACFTVAGGQGSRLGYEGPKGCFPGGAVSGKPLFQIFAEGIAATRARSGAPLPWYVMTSPLNHTQTVEFFKAHGFFGLPRADVRFFRQGVMPSFDRETGRLLLAEKHRLATNPDGHGGSLRALAESGSLEDMKARGIEHISYFQVDNPHVRVADPVFLGLHASSAASSGEMSSKMLPKADASEKVGVFCTSGGRVRVIEYSDMPAELAEQTDERGELRFKAGSIAIHAIGVSFVEKINSDPAFALPYHRAVKKVPHVDTATGERVAPDEPNAIKLERFVFDAIPMATRSLVLEADRVEEFAPIKNKDGVDSVETSRRLQTERAARWLEAAGVEVPRTPGGEPDCVLEISPLTALEASHLAQRDDLPRAIERGASVVL